MGTFSALLALCAGNSPVPVNSPHKGQSRGALMFSLIYAWINDWINNREAGDLRRWGSSSTQRWCMTCRLGDLQVPLQWRHNGHDGVSNHHSPDCLLNRLFSRRSKKASKLCVTGLCVGNSPVTGRKWPVTRKMFPFDDVIMRLPRVYRISTWWVNQVYEKYLAQGVHISIIIIISRIKMQM